MQGFLTILIVSVSVINRIGTEKTVTDNAEDNGKDLSLLAAAGL